ncbi:MAG: hypothetical protein Q4Q22_06230 [Methanosphaera sp.]|nr:hypothetical protein [Methanosphaera sp.]
MILFIGLGVACASDVDDAASAVQDADSLDVADAASSPLGSVVADSSKGSGNLPLEDDVGDDTDPGANPTQYNSISETTYNNAVITLDELSEENTVTGNELYVYNSNGITYYGNDAISSQGIDNEINNNLPSILLNNFNLINSKQIKTDGETIIINDDNIATYGRTNGDIWMVYLNPPANAHVIIDPNSNIRSIVVQLTGVLDVQITTKDVYSVKSGNTIVNTYLPYSNIEPGRAGMGFTIVNSVFLTSNSPSDVTLVNSTILTLNNAIAYDATNYSTYFDSNSHILSSNVPDGSSIILRARTNSGFQTYNNPMIINKPVNITSFDNANYDADISFVAGSEGSNITGLTLNGNLYINTGNINVKNNTVNNAVYIHDASNVVVEENVFNMDTIPIELTSSITSTIRNNNITTGSDYTITLDSECAENTITGNDLIAGTLQGDNSVLDNGQDNSISLNTPIVYTPELVVDTTEFSVGSPATITASIYLGEEVDTNVNKGKVVFKVNGKTLKDVSTGKVIYAKMNGGVATITDYEIPSSWAKDNITIQAVYSGSSQCDALRAEANLTVTKDSPAITTSDVTASKGETVTLTATVAAGNTPVNVGKVIFKVNGKTVKDSNGKVIYASVVNGQVSVNYTVPENMKAGSYNITVTFTAPGYEKLTDTKTLTVSA